MSVVRTGDATGLAVVRGDVVVGVRVSGAPDAFAPCLLSLVRHTPVGVPIVVWDDGSPGRDIEPIVARALGDTGSDRVVIVRPEVDAGVAACNRIIELSAPADVVLVDSDVVVAEGWLDGLRAAALSDDRVATATPLTNHGTIVSVPQRTTPMPGIAGGLTVDEAAARIRGASLRLRPELPTAVGQCVYIRRTALDLVGGFDEAFPPGCFGEVDFSQRCVATGLRHVCADDVFVFHAGSGSLASDAETTDRQARSRAIIEARYPYCHAWMASAAGDEESQLARVVEQAAAAMRRDDATTSVTIDARCLDRVVNGTQVHVLELIRALHGSSRASVRAVIPDGAGRSVREALAAMPGLGVVTARESGSGLSPTDVVHRPYQVSASLPDLEFVRALGRRFVITQQDFIAYDNPAYFDGWADFEAYRAGTRHALAVADRVVFLTRYVADDAVRRGLVDPGRAIVVNPGAGHLLADPHGPAGHVDRRVRQPYLVLAGSDRRHKNHRFAIDVVRTLRAEHGWEGSLVTCGVRVSTGAASRADAEPLLRVEEAAAFLIELGEVADGDMRGLLAHSSGVLYPTISEGFGFVPFEAGGVGVPCFFAPVTSLGEILPPKAALIEPWDVAETAERIARVLFDPAARAEHVGTLRAAAARYTWSATAAALLDAYEAARREPANRLCVMGPDGSAGA